MLSYSYRPIGSDRPPQNIPPLVSGVMVNCSCCGHCLEVSYDPDVEQFEAAIWERGPQHPMGLRERLRWCWRIMWTGNPWADHTMFDKEQAAVIIQFIKGKLKSYPL